MSHDTLQKCCVGIVLSLGLTACMNMGGGMDMQQPQQNPHRHHYYQDQHRQQYSRQHMGHNANREQYEHMVRDEAEHLKPEGHARKPEPRTQATSSKAAQKSYASKDPTQKATPGPVRKAAPQLPVIQ